MARGENNYSIKIHKKPHPSAFLGAALINAERYFIRMLKKSAIFIAVIAMVLQLVGCSSSEAVAGEEYILAARAAYHELDSARVDIINDDTGESEQIFIYKYDEKGMMTYSYLGKSETEQIAQYNNGYEQYTEENGEVTLLTSSDLGFCAYSRDIPYPYADEVLILFYKQAVDSELSYIAQNEAAIEVCHVYDVSKLAKADIDPRATGFRVIYYFDGEGNLLFLKEVTDITLEDGTQKTYSYSVYITERNEIEKVPNLVKVEAPENVPVI